MTIRFPFGVSAAFAALTLLVSANASAANAVRLINGTEFVLETEHPYAASENGIFGRFGLDVTVTQGSDGPVSLDEVIQGRQDVINGIDTLAVMEAFAKGAPVRILGSNIRGVGDIYWYVRPDSNVESLKDLDGGRALTYSRDGSTTHLAALFAIDALRMTAAPIPVGSPTRARTRLLAGQIDTGWAVWPVNARLVRDRQIRVIGTGAAAAGLRDVSIRVIAANADWLEKNRGVAQRLMSALFEGQMLSYTGDSQLAAYARRWKLAKEDVADAGKYTTLESATPLPVGGLAKLNAIAVKLGRIDKPLSAAQLRLLVQPMGNGMP